ncbi:MAG: hypothetical protein QM770_13365 [Tepidisphaeraceae bacterium]
MSQPSAAPAAPPSDTPAIPSPTVVPKRSKLSLLLALVAVLSLIQFGQQVAFQVRYWDLFPTTMTENHSIYAIWKIIHGLKPYEAPFSGHYVVAMYNWLFYASYAWVASLVGGHDENLIWIGRATSAIVMMIGAIAHLLVMLRVTRGAATFKSRFIVCASIAVLVWFGTPYFSGQALTIRPDAGSTCMAVLASLMVVTIGRSRWSIAMVACGLVFCLAWLFKQSTVWTLVATAGYLVVWERQLRRPAVLVLSMALPAMVILFTGDVDYRANATAGAKGSSFQGVAPAIKVTLYVLIENPLVWVGAAVVVLGTLWVNRARLLPRWKIDSTASRFDPALWAATVLAITFPVGVVMMFRQGSGPNNLMEPMVAAGTLLALGVLGYSRLDATRSPPAAVVDRMASGAGHVAADRVAEREARIARVDSPQRSRTPRVAQLESLP